MMNPFKCPDCERSFKKEIGLADHRHVMHDAPKPLPSVALSAPKGQRRPSLAEVNPACIECGSIGQLVRGDRIYPHRRDLHRKHFYLCPCGAYCGCHPGSVVPLGNPCGQQTRTSRMAAHDVFDPLWKQGEMTRHQAYAWLSEATGIDPDRCHIGMMTTEQARSVVRAVLARRERNAA